MEGSFLVHIILPIYELLHLAVSYNILPCCFEYQFYKLVLIDLFIYEVKLGKMPLEENARFQIVDAGLADQDCSWENDDQNLTFGLCFEKPLCFPKYHTRIVKNICCA